MLRSLAQAFKVSPRKHPEGSSEYSKIHIFYNIL